MLESSSIYRAIDANLNRLQEGLRVIEDINRYIYNNGELAYKIKSIRHQCKIDDREDLLRTRDSKGDVLKRSTDSETKRTNIKDILISNFKRAQESSRVLEECYKLVEVQQSEHFKSIRYQLYQIDKEQFLN